MTETEWMKTEWLPEELRRTYEDPSTDEMRREHAFWRYWSGYVGGLERPLSREELEQVVAQRNWHHVTGEIIVRCAKSNKLTPTNAAWALPYLVAHPWAADQIKALLLLLDQDTPWRDKLAKLLEYRADWAAAKILCALPAGDQPEAEAIIAASARHKSAKRWLLAVMSPPVKTGGN